MKPGSDPASTAVYVSADAADALVGPALASLPTMLHRTSDAVGSIHVIDGRPPSWPSAVGAAAGSGAAAVFVLEPSVPELSALDDVLQLASSIPIGVDLGWANNPALEFQQLADDEPLRAVVVHGSVASARGDDLLSGTVDAVVAVTRLMGGVPTLSRFAHDEWSASASGRWDGAVLRLSIVRSAAVGRGSRSRSTATAGRGRPTCPTRRRRLPRSWR